MEHHRHAMETLKKSADGGVLERRPEELEPMGAVGVTERCASGDRPREGRRVAVRDGS
jgi:hypothetical protein